MTLESFLLHVRHTHQRPAHVGRQRWYGMMRFYLNRLDCHRTLSHGVLQDAVNDTCFWHRQRENT